MTLQVTERQTTTQWYELSGELEARELFPNLLPNSKSVKEVEEDIKTEAEEVEGKYDGCPQEDDAMEDENAEFTSTAVAEFNPEALAAAKNRLTALKDGETLLRQNFEEAEEEVLEEAGKVLGVAVPWDPVEAAQIAAYVAAEEQRRKEEELQNELRAKGRAEVLEKARALFKAGNSHVAVRAMFPLFTNEIAMLVGAMRKEGVKIA